MTKSYHKLDPLVIEGSLVMVSLVVEVVFSFPDSMVPASVTVYP
jgi:hypothetical protein